MSAPFVIHRAVCVAFVAALALGGCTAPGSGDLAPAPKDLPASMRYVPSDAPAWVVADTDVKSKRWEELLAAVSRVPGTAGGLTVSTFNLDTTLGDLDPETWIGPAAGVVLLSTDSSVDDAMYGYADVDDRATLESALRAQGWTEGEELDGRGGSGLTEWTATDEVIAVGDDVVLVARTSKAIDTIVARAAEGRVSDDIALRKNTVEALRAAPLGVVFREDALANQLRRTVRDDPEQLELSRWIDDMSLVASVLDGWVGVQATDGPIGGVQLVGRLHWIEDALRVRSPEPVSREVLDALPSAATFGAAFDDLGLVAEDLVNSATANGSEFATEEDVATRDRSVELFSFLDMLRGDTAIARVDGHWVASVAVDDPRQVAGHARDVIKHAGIPGVSVSASKTHVAFGPRMRTLIEARPASPLTIGDRDDYIAAMDAAGAPPREPLLWMTALQAADQSGTACAGWLARAGSESLRFSFAIVPGKAPLTVSRGACLAPLAYFL